MIRRGRLTSVVVSLSESSIRPDSLDLCRENDSHDDTLQNPATFKVSKGFRHHTETKVGTHVDGDDLAEDNAEESKLKNEFRIGSLNGNISRNEATYEMRFLVLIRGALTPPPRIDDPVTKIPLRCRTRAGGEVGRNE